MKIVTPEEVTRQILEGSWRSLERLAGITNQQAEKAANSSMNPVLGGGTRLMLAIAHRLSDDVDLFITSPQWIGYLTPRLNDAIEEHVSDYHEGTTSLKLELSVGEIDYIVSTPLLGLPNEKSELSIFELEPVAEVLAKKLFYRGHAITARDVFDWRQIEQRFPASELHIEKMVTVLGDRLDGIEKALHALSKNDLARSVAWERIRTPYPLEFDDSIEWGLQRVGQLRELSNTLSQGSDNLIHEQLQAQGYTQIESANLEGSHLYIGPIVAMSAMHIAQDLGRGKVAVHDSRILNRSPSVGERVEIQMKEGKGHVASSHQPNKGLGR
ncbi:nucleotidyl transferase AbiEii/AbiGii toxin family protein [Comamonas testosteroni]|jgi:hypothetical protein|uniref:nucleotidyl transferase AbiEii/AbiGii toxin family protein n=1 Tax=Comamonas testosteroni TaxID=285 RepID=UPI0026E94B66|nr:nucleotidyl transferase AbiEii/AbiGii toxin family protein [Comamonas testosteroni]